MTRDAPGGAPPGPGGPAPEPAPRPEARTYRYPAAGPRDAPLLSVAPMMDWTDVYYRQLARMLSRRTWLYTEMVVDGTVLHAENLDRFLWHPEEQRPVVLQLGGSDAERLRGATAKCNAYGYTEINLNCGCPSDRVAGAGCFGATLMTDAERVGAAVRAMGEASECPVTVKCRIGVDDHDTYAQLKEFVSVVHGASGCRHFVVHARKAWLDGLNPHQNRTVPPLRHEWVFGLIRDFPDLDFSLNGGVMSCYQAAEALQVRVGGRGLAGVMIGRAAYNNPWQCLADADRVVYGEAENPMPNRRELLRQYVAFGDAVVGRFGQNAEGHQYPNVRAVVKPLLALFHGERGNKRWKQRLDFILREATSVAECVDYAIQGVPEDVLDAPPGAFPLDSGTPDHVYTFGYAPEGRSPDPMEAVRVTGECARRRARGTYARFPGAPSSPPVPPHPPVAGSPRDRDAVAPPAAAVMEGGDAAAEAEEVRAMPALPADGDRAAPPRQVTMREIRQAEKAAKAAAAKKRQERVEAEKAARAEAEATGAAGA